MTHSTNHSYEANKVLTGDGSYTLYNEDYNENYHSLVGAVIESEQKFLIPSSIQNYENPTLLDIGFGLGYNALVTLFGVKNSIEIMSLEKDETLLQKSLTLHTKLEYKEVLTQLLKTGVFNQEGKQLALKLGDARLTVKSLYRNYTSYFSHIYLDAFSPSVNPELWSVQFFKNLYVLLKQDGVLMTYSSSLAVIAALLKAGFSVQYTKAVGRKRGGLKALKDGGQSQLNEKDLFLLQNSVHAVPNVDKYLWTKEQIQCYRKKLQDFTIEINLLLPHKRAEKIWQKNHEK